MPRLELIAVASCLALLAGCGQSQEDLIQSGEQYMARQDYAAAAIQFRNAVQANPNDHVARMHLARANLNSGDLAAAEKEARKALELGHSKDEAVPLLARVHLARGDAEAVLREARENELTSAAAKIDLNLLVGVAYLELGKLDQADAAFQEVLYDQPAHSDARVGRAKVLFVRGQFDAARQTIEEVLAEDPKSDAAQRLRAELAYAQGDKDGAVELYQRLIAGNGREIDARFRLGLIRVERGEIAEAQRLVDEIGKASARDPRGPYLSAVLAWRQGDAKLAAERTNAVLRVQSDHAPSLLLNGLASLSTGQLETAMEHLQTVRKHPLYTLEASRALAQAHLSAGDPDKAIEVAEETLALVPGDAALQALIGEAAVAKGDIARATQVLGSPAAAGAGDGSMAAIRLGQALLASGDAAKGIGMLEVAAGERDDSGRATLTLALQHLRQGNYAEALKWIEQLERKSPGATNAQAIRGMVYAAQGKADAARKEFMAVLQREPDNALAIDSLGRLDLAQGRPADARTRYDAALAKWPGNESITMSYVAWLRGQQAKPDDVLSKVNALIVANPEAANAQLARVDLLLGYGRVREAVQAAQDLVAKRPGSKAALQALAKSQAAAGQQEQAIATYRKVAELEPGSEAAWMRLADVAALAGQHATAVSAAKKMLEIRPESIEARQRLARSYALQGNHSSALTIAREVQGVHPGDALGYIMEADIEASRKQLSAAADALRRALERSPDSSSAASKLHDVLTTAGKGPDADRGIDAWLTAHPKDTHARSYLAQRRALEGKYEASRDLFEQVVAVQPNDADAYNNLAWVRGKLEDPRALESARRAVALRPDQPAYLETLGALLLEQGKPAEAVDILQRAVDLQPGLAVSRLSLARALIAVGDEAGARRHLQVLTASGAPEAAQKEAQRLLETL